MEAEIKKKKESKKIKYIHRTFYVFLVLLVINIFWDIFAKGPKSPKHFFIGIIVIIGFSLFYFTVKNLKRYFTKKRSIKSKFFDSSALVPFGYLIILFLFLILNNVSTLFIDSVTDSSVSKIGNNLSGSNSDGFKSETFNNTYDNDFKNLIFFFNISMCKYAIYPLSAEYPELIKKFNKENIIDKKWVATTRMILISFLCSFLMQLLAINIAEKLIYRIVRKKRKASPHRKNKILAQTVNI